MIKRNRDQIMMMFKVKHLFNDHTSAWSGMPILADAFNEFLTYFQAIDDAQMTTIETTKGWTETKAMHRKALETEAFLMSKRLVSYMQVNSKFDLLSSVKFSPTDFARMKGKELIGACHNLHQESTKYILELAPFLITPTVLAHFLSLIDAFNQTLNAPKEKQNQNKEGNKNLRQSVATALWFLKDSMDNYIYLIKESNHLFWQQYQLARNIDNSPTRKRALTIQCVDAVTQMPIAHVVLEIAKPKIKRSSGAKGMSYVQHLAAGKHLLKASHPDYTSQTIEIVVVAKENTKVKVVL